MTINSKIANDILQAWVNDQEHAHRGRIKRKLPDEQRLAEILNVAFRASLKNEEGRPIRGSLTWLAEEELSANEIPKRRESPLVVKLSDPRPLDPEIVSKLVLSTDTGSSSLLVSWFGDIPKIWGILYCDPNESYLAQLPCGIPEARHFSPDALGIEITSAGSLVVTREGTVIGRVEKGEFLPAIATPFNSKAMGPHLNKLFNINVLNSHFATKEDGHKAQVLFSCLEYLLAQIDRLGVGATIIFIPEQLKKSAFEFADFPWQCTGGLELGKLIGAQLIYRENHEKHGCSVLGVLKANEALRHRLKSIAKLCSLDGAVLLSPDFEILGFGVKLKAPEFSGNVQEGPDGLGGGGNIMDFTRFGTRHNSTLRFVNSVKGSVAFVASSDGPIRGMSKLSDKTVICWPDCRLSMFI